MQIENIGGGGAPWGGVRFPLSRERGGTTCDHGESVEFGQLECRELLVTVPRRVIYICTSGCFVDKTFMYFMY